MKKAMIAMSGGVDSSVAAWLMKRDGYDCMGVTMSAPTKTDSPRIRVSIVTVI